MFLSVTVQDAARSLERDLNVDEVSDGLRVVEDPEHRDALLFEVGQTAHQRFTRPAIERSRRLV
ncbi:MAG TPA: hypothetical protein PK954_18845, partial [Anaerolineales bacterium]|nr:hypothetical protein [Anaerolineales bacterium]